MIQKLTHILLTLIFAGIPLALITLKYHKILSKNYRTIFSTLLIILGYSLVADNVAVFMKIWDFNEGLYTGIRIPLMPLDDLIFISLVQLLISSVVIVALNRNK